jgi:DNA repair protein RadA/Sms
MNKKTAFFCNQCGAEHTKWQGKCNECGAWNSLQEEPLKKQKSETFAQFSNGYKQQNDAIPITQVDTTVKQRIFTGLPELDRVLGGGLVPGCYVLLSGEPGIGKSTLLLQALFGLAVRGFKVLYCSGEESTEQIKLRADRLGTLNDNILLSSQTDLSSIFELVQKTKAQFLVVDSIQTATCAEIASAPGSVSQVRESAARLMEFAKQSGTPTIVIGHVTKDGAVAGPKLLEHLVDAVLHLEGDAQTGFRILRSLKNRFGSTGELGVFSMEYSGLKDVTNPSLFFLEATGATKNREGAAVTICVEGSRPLAVEVQALVGKTTFATPKRLATGLDSARFAVLVAVLEKRVGLTLGTSDIYAGIAGGLKLFEPAADLATATAVTSSLFDIALPKRVAYFGEVGLSGEVRAVTHCVARVQEATKLGFDRIVIPQRNYQTDKEQLLSIAQKSQQEIQIYPIEHVKEMVSEFRNMRVR